MSAGIAGKGGRLFGTDGVRGLANQALTPELALGLGRAAGHVLVREHAPDAAGANATPAQSGGLVRPRVVIGRDPRLSGDLLSAALAAGLMSIGLDVVDLGVFPTPGVAYLTRELSAAAGAVVSASHNPFPDNGIKFFTAAGTKLTEQLEDSIAALVEAGDCAAGSLPRPGRPAGPDVGRLLSEPAAAETYIRHICGTVSSSFAGVDIVLDCANGATSGLAREVFARLGARLTMLACEPDGLNINDGCGSTHPQALQRTVTRLGADLGLAFDGDGDRVVAVDGSGRLVDGDGILALCGLDLLERGQLSGRALVATVLSNLGLDAAFAAAGGRVLRAPVGDRQVYARMVAEGLILGGEQAGHIIFLAHNSTGDGLITAVQVVDTLVRRGQGLAETMDGFTWFPQAQRGVRWSDPGLAASVMSSAGVEAALRRIEQRLAADGGRVVLRPSGTEPLIRIMVEAACEADAERYASELEEVIRAGLASAAKDGGGDDERA